MSGKLLASYRLPTATATKIGSVKIVKDRHGKIYADGQKVAATSATGAHTIIELADGRNFYVLTAELDRVPRAKGR